MKAIGDFSRGSRRWIAGGKGARRGKSTVGLDISRTNRKVPIRSHLLQFPLSRSSSNHHSHPFPPMKCQDSDGLFPETHPLWVNSETSPRAKLLATGNHSKIHFFRPTARFHLFPPAKMERITGGMEDDFIDTLNHYHLLLFQYCHYYHHCPPSSISAMISLLFPAAGGGPPDPMAPTHPTVQVGFLSLIDSM